jgi:hypothetical protein
MNQYIDLIDKLEKGGKPAQIGETRNYGGKQYQKMGNGEWKLVVHPEEKQLEAEQNKNKVVSLTDKLKSKIAEKKEVTASAQHVDDLKSQAVVPNEETRSGKPMFTSVESALAHGYDATDFREVGNFFYNRAQQMAENVQKLNDTKQKVDPNFEKIKSINLKMGKQFLSQANRVDDRQAKTKAATKVKKSTTSMGHNDGAEINTADYAIDRESALHGIWLDRIHMIMEGYQYGDTPRVVALDDGDLYLVKVDDGMYSAVFKKMTYVDGGILEDNAKIRIERMTLPSLVQLCLAKEWIRDTKDVSPVMPEPAMVALTAKLEEPILSVPMPEPSELDKKIRLMELVTKLLN